MTRNHACTSTTTRPNCVLTDQVIVSNHETISKVLVFSFTRFGIKNTICAGLRIKIKLVLEDTVFILESM